MEKKNETAADVVPALLVEKMGPVVSMIRGWYLCDPEKNRECGARICGGNDELQAGDWVTDTRRCCISTMHRAYARETEDGKPLEVVHYRMQRGYISHVRVASEPTEDEGDD